MRRTIVSTERLRAILHRGTLETEEKAQEGDRVRERERVREQEDARMCGIQECVRGERRFTTKREEREYEKMFSAAQRWKLA